MRNKEKEDLMEAVFGKNAKRRTFMTQDYSMKSETDRLKQQSNQLNQMMKDSNFSESDYQKLKQEIEQDFGVSLDVDGTLKQTLKEKKLLIHPQDITEISESLSDCVLGQNEAALKLIHAFSKPFVLRDDADAPLFVILICGKPGTGKSEMLTHVMKEYQKRGYFQSDEIGIVDCSLYSSNEHDGLFVQDVYAAMQKGEVTVFDHFQETSFYLMPMLEQIVKTGCIQLKKRYVANKGQLQETGTTLSASAIDSLSFSGKGIVFLADAPLNELYGTIGTGFIKGFDDIVETGRFQEDALNAIVKKKLDDFCEQCMKLNLVVSADSSVVDELKLQFDEKLGLESFDFIFDSWLKALVQMKIEENIEEIKEVKLKYDAGHPVLVMDQKLVHFMKEDEQDQLLQEQKILDELNEIVGLKEIKEYVLSLKDHYRIQKIRAQKGLKTNSVSMHMIFTGNPGTGKTTIARIISRYLKAIGILSSGQLVEVTRADLVGRYVGHTAPQTAQVIESALGGVLFIDEAYSLYRGKDDSFGLEAIDTLVKGIEDHRENLLVILAGYTKEMKEFLTSNSGLKSRFPNVIEFPDYTAEELLLITKSIAKSKQYILHFECDKKLLDYYELVQKNHAQDAGNGRLARNLVEAAILKQSRRCLLDETAALDELKAVDFELDEVMTWQ